MVPGSNLPVPWFIQGVTISIIIIIEIDAPSGARRVVNQSSLGPCGKVAPLFKNI